MKLLSMIIVSLNKGVSMTYREIMILLSGATQGQAAGVISSDWYHELLVSLLKGEETV